MSFWLAIVIIVVVGSLTEIVRQYFKSKEKSADISGQKLQEFMRLIDKHEERLSNLETVILDLEKIKKYQDL
ncbi:MAG: hypothetical protein H8D65_00145 [Spirochaetes bacterium]|nr:hypothetical protein [Spirochaetota bacterium]